MKRLFLFLLAGVLSGCLIVTPTPSNPPTPVPDLDVLEATYNTDYSANGVAVICDNRPTTLTYRFRYEGELVSWTSYLEGQILGERKGERTFDPRSQGVVPVGEQGFEVQYVMSAYFAPYENGATAPTPEAIDVVPVPQPVQIGATKLYLTLSGVDEEAHFESRDIPVISNCP